MIEALLGALAGIGLAAIWIATGLRKENVTLIDHITRVQRREAGMSELPKQPPLPEAQRPVEIPDDFENLILAQIESEGIRNVLRSEYRERRARGTPHEQLMAELLRQLSED